PIGFCLRGRSRSWPLAALRSRDPPADVGERFRKADRARGTVVDLLAIKAEAGGVKLHPLSVSGPPRLLTSIGCARLLLLVSFVSFVSFVFDLSYSVIAC